MIETTNDETRGKAASRPSQYNWSDWKKILWSVKDEIAEDNLSLIAAGVAFYAMLALFPSIAALVGVYGIIADPTDIAAQLDMVRRLFPEDAFSIVEDQVLALTSAKTRTLGLASTVALLLAFWSAKNGVNAMITGLNIVYDEKNTRSLIAGMAITLALTGLLMLVVLVAIGAVIIAPAMLEILSLGLQTEWIASLIRWPIVLTTVAVGVAALYRYGPDRRSARVRWITWGAAIATVVWLIASILFSLYVSNFANYNETYGSLGAIVALLMWFYISAFIVLAGAELNAEMEHYTRCDSTVGPDRPMGQRGAYVADTLP